MAVTVTPVRAVMLWGVFSLLLLSLVGWLGRSTVLVGSAFSNLLLVCAIGLGIVFIFMTYANRTAWLILLLIAELLAIAFSYYTLGDITSKLFFFLAVCLNLIPVLMWSLQRSNTALIIATIIAAIIVSYQVILGIRWFRLHQEASQIVAYAHQIKQETGTYPKNLTAYTFQDSGWQTHFNYSTTAACEDFCLRYYIGSPNTGYHYQPTHGWFYEDD